MKKKFQLWLDIVTICLCICAIAVGVYSTQQATLNMSGALGFTMHTSIVELTGSISNIALFDGEGYYCGSKDISRTIKGSDNGIVVNTLDLGELNFYKGKNMIFSFTFKNLGTESLVGTFKILDLGSRISLVESGFDSLPTAKTLTAEGTNTLNFALNLIDDSEALSNINFTITITFVPGKINESVTIKEYTSEEKIAIREKTVEYYNTVYATSYDPDEVLFNEQQLCYAERFPYYATMGVDPVTKKDIRWLIVGYMENNKIKLLDESDNAVLSTGKILAKNYVLLSAQGLSVTENSDGYYMSYQNEYSPLVDSDDDSYTWYNKYGAYASDYLTSNIRQYLKNSDKVYRTYTEVDSVQSVKPKTEGETTLKPFEEMYNFSSSSLYEKIKPRLVNDLYADIIEEAKGNDYVEITGVPNISDTLFTDTGETLDKFWLLSYTEVKTLFLQDGSNVENEGYCASAITTSQGDGDEELKTISWWYRSLNPEMLDSFCMGYCDDCFIPDYGPTCGYNEPSKHTNSFVAVRPAFILKGE